MALPYFTLHLIIQHFWINEKKEKNLQILLTPFPITIGIANAKIPLTLLYCHSKDTTALTSLWSVEQLVLMFNISHDNIHFCYWANLRRELVNFLQSKALQLKVSNTKMAFSFLRLVTFFKVSRRCLVTFVI